MNKTVSVNIGGYAFKLDEDAFNKIKRYLDAIKSRFAVGKEQDEILADIESRISEIFSERLRENKEVINLEDVDYMIGIMGQPHDIGEESRIGDETFETADPAYEESRRSKRLFRDSDDKILGGVASGLSAYFGIKDPIWLRLLIVILTIAGVGSMILIYIILWIIIPEAKTRSEKLQMRGKEANLANIEQAFKKGIENLEDSIKDLGSKKKAGQVGNFFRTLIAAILTILLYVLKFIAKFLGVLILVVGAISFAVLTIALIINRAFITPGVSEITDLAFANDFQSVIFFIGVFLVAAIPLLALTYLGIRIVIGSGAKIKGLGVSMLGLWILGIILTSAVAIKAAVDFGETASVEDKSTLFLTDNDTLIVSSIKFNETEIYEKLSSQEDKVMIAKLHMSKDQVFLENVDLFLKEGSGTNYQITIDKRAKGKTDGEAAFLARKVQYDFEQSETELRLPDYLTFSRDDKFRDQNIDVTLWVPEGKAVKLDESLRPMLKVFSKDPVHKSYTAYNNYWINTGETFSCISCDSVDIIGNSLDKYPVKVLDYRDFNSLDISGLFKVDIQKSDDYKVHIQGDESDVSNIESSINGDELTFETRRKFKWNRKSVRIMVEMPNLNMISLSGGSEVAISGFEQEKMRIESRGTAETDIFVNVTDLELEARGASEIDLSGSGKNLNIELTGASELNAIDYIVENISIEIAGASEVSLYATEKIKGELSGACSVKYAGDPIVEFEKSGISSVRKID